ncbi:MAG: GntG family PLP-dependent aldolase [Bacteroidota bacterium]
MTVDFRSDTLTRPTPGMLAAMMEAKVGDDVYGEDPSMLELEAWLADYFGMEAGLFCPSGTMCNQIAIRISTRPQDQVICDHRAHVYLYEGGGIAANSLASVKLLEGNYGRLTAAQVEAAINPDDPHFPRTSLVCLENTMNKGGGACYDLEEIEKISTLCHQNGLRLHLDGARLFNALVAKEDDPKAYGKAFDTISICLSKGLGAPVGSVLVGSHQDRKEALRVRKMMGGGMRQAGYLAAAGLYALQHQKERLAIDHKRAGQLASVLLEQSWVADVFPTETNIVVFRPDQQIHSTQTIMDKLSLKGIRASGFGPGYIRLVTHLDLNEAMIDYTCAAIAAL